MKKILIAGDSFAADWPDDHSFVGWPQLMKQHYLVHNVAQAGCSEYKIFKQLENNQLDHYDAVVMTHTSPYRIPVESHPLHHSDPLHNHCDFIYQDIKSSDDPAVACVTEYYEKYYWQEHALFVHKCTLQEEKKLLQGTMCLHLTMLYWDNQVEFDNLLDCQKIFHKHRGNVNHLDKKGNQLVFEKIQSTLQNLHDNS